VPQKNDPSRPGDCAVSRQPSLEITNSPARSTPKLREPFLHGEGVPLARSLRGRTRSPRLSGGPSLYRVDASSRSHAAEVPIPLGPVPPGASCRACSEKMIGNATRRPRRNRKPPQRPPSRFLAGLITSEEDDRRGRFTKKRVRCGPRGPLSPSEASGPHAHRPRVAPEEQPNRGASSRRHENCRHAVSLSIQSWLACEGQLEAKLARPRADSTPHASSHGQATETVGMKSPSRVRSPRIRELPSVRRR